ncbi:MAG: DegT/DnrJ/EryC1/StrS family aminotransferase [Betaproteobacteria bacterium]
MKNYKKRASFLVFGSPAIGEEEIAEVVKVLRSGWVGTGPKVAQFTQDFAAYKQAKYAVAVNSATAALHLSFLASGLKPGDEVITTANTFCATVNAIIHTGATPVLVDVDPATSNLDTTRVEAAVTSRTRAICPVHFAGLPCDMDEIERISVKNGLSIVEDCAHAIETQYKGRPVGTIGDFGCFSFYATKNVVTAEGGMILAREERHADRLNILGLHGMSKDAWKRFGDAGYKHYQVVDAGFKYNMTDIQAAMGIHQLARVEKNWIRRKKIWETYTDRLKHLPLGLPAPAAPTDRHAYHLFPIRIDESKTGIARDDFLNQMTVRNIGVGVHYLSIPEHPYYQQAFGWKPDDFPEAKAYGRQTVSLPLSAKLTDDDVEDVILAVENILSP